jgi:hypothetical protein
VVVEAEFMVCDVESDDGFVNGVDIPIDKTIIRFNVTYHKLGFNDHKQKYSKSNRY